VRVSRIVLALYVIAGVVVASRENYLQNLDNVKRVISALLSVLLWPLLLLGVDVRIR
jgi:hypothetical protein